MAKSNSDITKPRQIRASIRGTPVLVRLQADDLTALDAYRADGEPMTRPQAIRVALADWLRTHGYVAPVGKDPIGPATEVVNTMDAAIKSDRKARR